MMKPGSTIPRAAVEAATNGPTGVGSNAKTTAQTTISPIDCRSVNWNRVSRMAQVLGPRLDRALTRTSGEDPIHIDAPPGKQRFRIDRLPALEGSRLIGSLGPIDMDALGDRIN